MADMHDSKASPPETLVNRADRELRDLRKVARRNWIVALFVVLGLGLYAAFEIGLFHKKENPKDLSAGILAMATHYQELNDKYQKLEGEVQQKNDEEKETQIRGLKAQLDDARLQLAQRANYFDSVIAANPQTYGGVSLVPSQVVYAWESCVQSSKSASGTATVAGIPVRGGMSTEDKRCTAILQQSLSKISKTTD
jgi:hypothetical protein